MIKGIGTDIVEIGRITRALEKGDGFKKLVFSEEEIAYCEKNGKGNESFAGRFAAKEAFLKALGTGWRGEIAFHEIAFINDGLGKPVVSLQGKTKEFLADYQNCHIHVSISHSNNYATAVVVIEEV
jgi:holo-[acyl-carrier protein] synthase